MCHMDERMKCVWCRWFLAGYIHDVANDCNVGTLVLLFENSTASSVFVRYMKSYLCLLRQCFLCFCPLCIIFVVGFTLW